MNRPTLVALDMGNTSIHCGVVSQWNGERPQWDLQLAWATASFEPNQLVPLREYLTPQTCWRVSSVHRPSEQSLSVWMQRYHPQVDYRVLNQADLPLVVQVEIPERVGMDRLMAAVAANQLRPMNSAAIVVDAGTAITVDLVSAEGVFQGGAILPGLRLVARALATGTDLLPMVESCLETAPSVLGKNTTAAIQSGLFWGSLGAVRELIRRLQPHPSSSSTIFLTGGDAARLMPLLSDDECWKGRIWFVEDLVLWGIALATKP
jgi:type III pantothenate kinase